MRRIIGRNAVYALFDGQLPEDLQQTLYSPCARENGKIGTGSFFGVLEGCNLPSHNDTGDLAKQDLQ